MTALTLTPRDRRAHRAAAHHLQPVVMIGDGGLSEGVLKEADLALKAHGLVKVRVASEDRVARAAMLDSLCEALSAAPVQHIGKLLVLWRPKPAETAPERDQAGAGPRVVTLVKFSKSGNHRPQVKKVRVLGNERVTAGGSIKRARGTAKTSVKKLAQRKGSTPT